jgi:sec-independent protein translocase protein TatA
MPELGAPELMLVLLITLLVFGGSKVADIGGSLGKGIKEFKNAMKEDVPASAAPAAGVAVVRPGQPICSRCSSPNLDAARFCNECGAPMTSPASPVTTTTAGA